MCFQGARDPGGEGMAHMEEPELPDHLSPTPAPRGDALGTGGTGGTSPWVALDTPHSTTQASLRAPAPIQVICVKHF